MDTVTTQEQPNVPVSMLKQHIKVRMSPPTVEYAITSSKPQFILS
jgi:hypothetical protein